jgi:hypothetical protein
MSRPRELPPPLDEWDEHPFDTLSSVSANRSWGACTRFVLELPVIVPSPASLTLSRFRNGRVGVRVPALAILPRQGLVLVAKHVRAP